jgi:Tol biopolymer transport system component
VPAWENVGVRVRNRSWAYAGDTLVYWPNLRTARQLVWVDRQGRQEPLRMPANKYSSPRLSPDGRRIAVIVEGTSSEFGDVWLHDLGTGANVQLTHGSRSGPVAWTPDGASLVVSMRQGGSNDLYRVRADGGEPEGVLVGSSGFLAGAYKQPVGWTEGGLILHQTGMRGRQPRFWAVALDTGSAPRAILTDSTAWAGRVSVDGRWIAYTSGESGRFEVYVARLPEGRPKWRLSGDGGRLPLWARGGRELFYRNGTRMMAVPVTTNGTFVPGEPRQLFEGEFYQVDPGEPHYDVSLDDQRFLVVQRGTTDGPERLNVIQGWRSEIERRLRDAR